MHGATAALETASLIRVPSDWLTLEGELSIPESPRALVVFAHGSGSSHHSPRNQLVARHLRENGFATLLFDLLSEEEQLEDLNSGQFRFDIPLLSHRLVDASRWAEADPRTAGLPLVFFGASTGAAAALAASVRLGPRVASVVSRGGRADLASAVLAMVSAPTLLIVGGRDLPVLRANESALEKLTCRKSLAVVPGATHLFEEPGALQQVARLSQLWLEQSLKVTP